MTKSFPFNLRSNRGNIFRSHSKSNKNNNVRCYLRSNKAHKFQGHKRSILPSCDMSNFISVLIFLSLGWNHVWVIANKLTDDTAGFFWDSGVVQNCDGEGSFDQSSADGESWTVLDLDFCVFVKPIRSPEFILTNLNLIYFIIKINLIIWHVPLKIRFFTVCIWRYRFFCLSSFKVIF